MIYSWIPLNQCSLPKCWMNYFSFLKSSTYLRWINSFFLLKSWRYPWWPCSWHPKEKYCGWLRKKKCSVRLLQRSLVHELFIGYPKYPWLTWQSQVHEQVHSFCWNLWTFPSPFRQGSKHRPRLPQRYWEYFLKKYQETFLDFLGFGGLINP